jgi:hypothetical protein
MSFTKFQSIDSFSHVCRYMGRKMMPTPTKYGAKIKLHGTNGGIRIHKDGSVTAQSRTRDLTLDADNAGFGAWVAKHADQWRFSADVRAAVFHDFEYYTVFGEWAGKGIQRNDAVTKLDDKYFFVFAVQIGDNICNDPALLQEMMPDLDHLLVLPWHMAFAELDWNSTEQLNAFVDAVNEEVEDIGECDPFIKSLFGIEGVGEGLVLTPVTGQEGMDRDEFAALTFKAKSEAHRVKSTAKAVTKRVSIPDGVQDMVTTFVTDARCEQGLTEACDGIPEKARTADFLKWMGGDVQKESKVELEEMGLEWKEVAKHVNKAAVSWFMKRCQSMATA